MLGRFGAAVWQHFADATFYARRFRASRLGGRPVEPTPDPAATAAARFRARLTASLRSSLCRLAERQTSSPSAVDLWLARPAVFGAAVLIGSAATLATLDTPRTAPFSSTLVPIGGAVLAWTGLLGAADYIRYRWPWAASILLSAWLLLAFGAIVVGFALVGHAVSFIFLYLGLGSLVRLMAFWWKSVKHNGRSDLSR